MIQRFVEEQFCGCGFCRFGKPECEAQMRTCLQHFLSLLLSHPLSLSCQLLQEPGKVTIIVKDIGLTIKRSGEQCLIRLSHQSCQKTESQQGIFQNYDVTYVLWVLSYQQYYNTNITQPNKSCRGIHFGQCLVQHSVPLAIISAFKTSKAVVKGGTLGSWSVTQSSLHSLHLAGKKALNPK